MKTKFHIIFCFISVFILIGNSAFGQAFSFKHFSEEEGMPSSYLYDLVQDAEGYIWMSSEGGLCKFDGTKFIKNPIKELENKEVINLYYLNGRLWFMDLSTNLYYWENNELVNCGSLGDNYLYSQLVEDEQGDVWIWNKSGLVLLEEVGAASTPTKKIYQTENSEAFSVFFKNNAEEFKILGVKGSKRFSEGQWKYEPYSKEVKNMIAPKFHTIYKGRNLVMSRARLYFYDDASNTMEEAFTEFETYFETGLNYLYVDDNDNLWVSLKDGVLLITELSDGSFEARKMLQDIFVGVVFQDEEGSFWFTTQRSGLFFLASLEIDSYLNEELKGYVSALAINEAGQLFMGYDNSWMLVLDKNKNEIYKTKFSVNDYEVYDIDFDSSGNIYIVTSNGIIIWDKNFTRKDYINGSFKDIAIDENDNVSFCTFQSFGEIVDGELQVIKSVRSYALEQLNNQTWYGTTEGLFKYQAGNLTKIGTVLEEKDVRGIKLDGNNLWISTQGSGVYLFNTITEQIMEHFTTENGLVSNNCGDILTTDNGVWIATNNGIVNIDADKKLVTVNREEGLASNEINGLSFYDGKIHAATNKGLSYFSDAINISNLPPTLYINSIRINGLDVDLKTNFDLPHFQNNVRISFAGVGFKQARNMEYQFKMDNLDEDWVSSNSAIASYPSLPIGEYKFKVRARKRNSIWSLQKQLSFNINPPFYETAIFMFLVIASAFLLGGLSLSIYLRNLKRRNEVSQKLKESQLTALRTQMNPHFLFNSLNSIQEFIMKEDKRSANRYLSRFSKLMRKILNNSNKEEITLKEELESLELYLELEALRFEEDFEYHILVQENIDPEIIRIPSMLVQPYVENAVKHGLMHKKGKKNLYLRFKISEAQLICEIEDDGIGRAKSAEIKMNNDSLYPSKAMSLTQERLDILNSKLTDKINLKIEDLINHQQRVLGTKVIIGVPFSTKSTKV